VETPEETVVQFLRKDKDHGKFFKVRKQGSNEVLNFYIQHHMPIEIDTSAANKADVVVWCHPAGGPHYDTHPYANSWDIISVYQFDDRKTFVIWEGGGENMPEHVKADMLRKAENYTSSTTNTLQGIH
jgi:hypothetical protein